MSKVVIVTGATRGLGRALADELAKRGHKVYGAGRSWPDQPGDLAFTPIKMDVGDDASVKDAVRAVIDKEGRVDVLVNNAGISHSGSIEETPLELGKKIFETNYFGPIRVINAVLPTMREKGGGTIAIVGSAAGRIGVPFQGHYAASKFAVEGLSETLKHELSHFGIRVLLFEPGDVGTTIWNDSQHVIPEGSPYKRALERYHGVKEKEMGQAADPPENVAHEVAKVLESNTTRLRHPVAKGAPLFMLARKLLPDSIFLWAVGKNYKV